MVPAAQAGCRASAGGGDRGGRDRRQQHPAPPHRRADRGTGIRHARPDGAVLPGGRLVPYDLYGEQPKVWRNLRFPRSQMPADAIAVRVVAEDLSLTAEDWIAVTPPRVPELRSLQEYVGSTQPVLMDWAVGLAFPCQQPMLHVNGVTEIPKFRITPDYTAKKQDTDTWQDGVNGGLLGITDLLLRAHVMSTYLSHDWGRDWGRCAGSKRSPMPRPRSSTSAPRPAPDGGRPARSASSRKLACIATVY